MVARLVLLGSPRLFDPNGNHVRLPEQGYALAARLALSRDQWVARQTLAHLLWGDAPGRSGSLRKLLWRVRQTTGEAGFDFVETDDVGVRLVRQDLDIDVTRIAAFSAAEALTPRNADLLADHADALVHASEIPAALIKIRAAMDLNPLCPDRYLWAEASAQFFAENYPATLDAVGRMSDRRVALRLEAAAHAMMHEKMEAKLCVRRALDLNPDFRLSRWLQVVPSRNPAFLQLYEQALRSAGFH